MNCAKIVDYLLIREWDNKVMDYDECTKEHVVHYVQKHFDEWEKLTPEEKAYIRERELALCDMGSEFLLPWTNP